MAVHNKINRKKFLAASALALTTAMITIPGAANADDSHAWVFQNGGGSFSTDVSLPNTTTITQTTDRAIGIGNTSIGVDQSVNILQNNSGSLFVAKDNTGHASDILGHLSANGGVIVLNENGVIFGKTAVINVGSIIASTGHLDDVAFMRGDSKLELTNFGDGQIVNEGTINVAGAGLAALVAPTVVNNGIIQAKLGKVVLAAGGEKATVDLYGDGLIELTLGDSTAAAKIENAGTIEGKTVLMTAAAAKDVVDTVINMTGVVKASSVTEQGGKIVLNGGSSGKVNVTGTLDASGEKGGSVKVTGHDINIAAGSKIAADGGQNGDGGNIIVYADNQAIIEGSLSARGGALGGNGGSIETSGTELSVSNLASIDASAANGTAGNWLLDPLSIIIASGNGTTTTGTDGKTYAKVNSDALSTSLSGGTSVTIETGVNSSNTNGSSNQNEGDIIVQNSITKAGNTTSTLTLLAQDDIIINSTISASAGKLNVDLEAGKNSGLGNGNDVTINSNITTNGGTFLANADGSIGVNAAVSTGAGSATLNAKNGSITLGANGVDGTSGGTGISGGNGAAGTDGSNATSSHSGTDGHDGSNGSTGTTGSAGANGANGGNGSITTTTGNISLSATGTITLGGSAGDGGKGGAGGTGGSAGDGGDGGNASSSRSGGDGGDGGDGGKGGTGGSGGTGGAGGSGTLTSTNGTISLVADDVSFSGNGGSAGTSGNTGSQGSSGSSGSNGSGTSSTRGIGGSAGTRGVGGTGGAAGNGGAAGSGSISTGGTVKIDRASNGDINLGGATGGLSLTDAELNKITAGALSFGGANTSAINVKDVDLTDNVSGLVTLTTGRDTGSDDSITFTGTDKFKSLLAHANDSVIFANNAVVDVAGNATFTGDDNDAGVGDFNMGTGAQLKTHGGAVSISVLNVQLGDNAAINTSTGVAGKGGDVSIDADHYTNNDSRGKVTLGTGAEILADGGNIDIDNAGIFSGDANSLNTNTHGTIDVNQWVGGSIQNVINAVNNGGDGVNTIHIGAGTFTENLNVNKSVTLEGAKHGIDGANASRGSGETIVNGTASSQSVNVSANNVVIDGLTIDGKNSVAQTGLNIVNSNNVTVKNTIVKNVTYGINDRATTTTATTGLKLLNNLVTGFKEQGISITKTTGAEITGNTLLIGKTGITATNADSVKISQNKIGSTGAAGNITGDAVDVVNSASILVSGNAIANGLGNGIFVDPSSGTISGNTITNVALNGLYLLNDSNVTVGGLTAADGNTIDHTGLNGILISGGSSNTAQNNIINNTGKDGISVSGSTGTHLYENAIGYNNLDGAAIHSAGTNNIGSAANGGDGVYATDADGIIISGNKITGTTYNAANRKGSGILVTNTDGFQIGSTAPADKNTITNVGSDGIVVRADGGTANGGHIDGNTINGAARTGIYTENAANVYIRGNTISGTGLDAAIFDNGGSNFTISGNTLNHNAEEGILVWNGAGTTLIDGNTIDNTGEALKSSGANVGDGVHVQNTSGLTVSNNNIGKNGGNIRGDGIYVTGSNGVVIKGNAVNDTKFTTADVNGANGSGIQVVETNGVTIGGSAAGEANTITNTQWDGVRLQNDSNVSVSSNHVTGTGRVNIWGGNVNTASIVDNVLRNDGLTGYGSIHADGGSSWTVSGNNVDNADYGIFLNGVSGTNQIDSNIVGDVSGAYSITADGIRAISTSNLTISGNTVGNQTGVNGDSIHVENSTGVKILNNYALSSIGSGIFVKNSDNALLSGNFVDSITFTNGIDIENSDNVQVTGNNVGYANDAHTGDGIVVQNGSDNATVSGNTVKLAAGTGDGISIKGGLTQTVSGNTVNGGTRGIILSGTGDGASVSGNTVGQTTGSSNNGIELANTGTATVSTNHVYNAGWDNINVNGGNAAVTVSGNDVHNAVGASGIVFYGHNGGGSITGNTVENSARLGIYDGASSGVTISGNTVTNSGTANVSTFTDGIFVEQANTVTIDGNKVNTTKGDGIRVGGIGNGAAAATTGIVVENNKIANTGADGLAVLDSNGAQITGNKVGYLADGTTSAGADNIHGDGILVSNSDSAVIKTNTVTETHSATSGKGSGISVVDSDSVMIGGAVGDANVVSNADWDGIRVTTDTGTSNLDTIQNNTVTNTARAGIYSAHATSLLIDSNAVDGATAAIGIPYGAISSDWGSDIIVSNNIVKNSTDGILMYSVGGTNTIGANNKIDFVTNNAINVQDTSNLTITGNQIGQNGGHIGGNGIFIDPSNNATITGNVITGALNGIYSLNNDDMKIYSNTISGSVLDGILVSGGKNVTIGANGKTNTVTSSGDDGIDVDNVTGTVSVAYNTVDTTTAGYTGTDGHNGIEVSGTSGAEIKANHVNNAGWDGINVQQASGTQITGNFIADTKGASGIGLLDSSNTNIQGNDIRRSQQYGMYIGGSTGTLSVTGNLVRGVTQSDGIYVTGSDTPVITGNFIDAIAQDGISVNGNGTKATVNTNFIGLGKNGTTGGTGDNADSTIGRDGIRVVNAAGSEIKSNKLGNLGRDGINVTDSAGVMIGGTTSADGNKIGATGSANNIGRDGIHVEDSASAQIRYNQVGKTVNDGIYLDPSDYSVIASNTITTTGGDGIESADNNYVTIGGTAAADGNTISGAGAHGINVHGGVSALIQNNKVQGGNGSSAPQSGAHLDGIHVENNENVNILNNTIAAGQGIVIGKLNFSGGNGADQNGIYVSNSDNAVIDQNNVTGDVLGNGVGAGVDGIRVVNSNTLTIGGLTPLLNGNKIVSTGGDGISIDGSTGLLVLNNIIGGLPLMDVAGDGIQMNNTLGSLVAANIITHVAGNGIVFTDGTLSGIGLNVITDAGKNGIEISNSSLLAVGLNQITTTGQNGIALNGVLLAAVLDNNISKTGADGINAALGAGLLISGNTIKTTGGDGIDAGFVAFTDIVNNTIDDTTGDGVRLFAALNGTVNDNTISNTDGDGIDAALVYNLDIKGNGIKHAGANGVAATLVANADIINNVIDDIKGDGVQLTGALNAAINGNTITNAKDDGIDAAFVYGLDVNGNTVDLTGDNGIEASFVANANVNDNKIGLAGNVGGNGIDLRNSAFVTIAGNDIGTNVANNGIYVDPSFNITIDGNNVDGAGVDGIHAEDTNGLIISNNIVTNSGQDGVEVRNGDKVQLLSNLISNSGSRGLYVSGQNNVSVVLKGNIFNNNLTGAEFETGTIDLTATGADHNTFNGGDVALKFNPTVGGDPHKLVLVNDGNPDFGGTIGETEFNGQTTFYVQLANGAFFDPGTPTIIDGFHATFDGFRPDTVPFLTLAQFNAINAKIFDYRDDNTLGLFFIGNVPEVDQKDLLKEFGAFGGTAGKFRITITGLPKTGGTGGSFAGGGNIANLLASITPAAGGNDAGKAKGKTRGVTDIANIEPAAGVDTPAKASNDNGAAADTACWSQAVAKASAGSSVDYSFGGTMEEAITQTASCGSGT